MALQDTDLLLVQRGTQSYKLTGANAKSDLGGGLQEVTDRGNTTTNGITLPRIAAQPVGDSDAYIQATNQTTGKVVSNFFGNGNIALSDDLTAQTKIELKGSDGSASFAGQVLVRKEDSAFEAQRASGTKYFEVKHNNYELTLGTNDEISLKGDDGSASFAGNLDVASYCNFNYDGVSGERVSVGDYAPLSAKTCILGFNSANTAQFILNAVDGNASFVGNITSGSLNSTSNTATGIEIYGASGRINVQRPSTQGSDQLWNGYLGSTSTSEIFADGSAEFSGKVETIGDTAAFHVGTDKDANKVPLNIYDTADSNKSLARILGDGSANFAGGVEVGTTGGGSANDGTFVYSTRFIDVDNHGSAALNAVATDGDLASLQVIDRSAGGGETVIIKPDGSAEFNGRVSGSVSTIPNNSAFALTDSNFWTAAGGTWVNPTQATAGQSGVIYVQAEVNAFGNFWSFPGGVTPTIPANSVVPYYVESSNKIRLGLATEDFV